MGEKWTNNALGLVPDKDDARASRVPVKYRPLPSLLIFAGKKDKLLSPFSYRK